MIHDGYYEFADGGFVGCQRCITPFLKTTIESIVDSNYYVSNSTSKSIVIGKYGIGINQKMLRFEINYVLVGQIFEDIKFVGYIIGHLEMMTKENDNKNNNDEKSVDENNFGMEFDEELNLNVYSSVEIRENKFLLKEIMLTDIPVKIKSHKDFIEPLDYLKDLNGNNAEINVHKVNKNSFTLFNTTLSSTRILVENYFGRMTTKFKMSKTTFIRRPEKYDIYNRVLTALTNCHINEYSMSIVSQ